MATLTDDVGELKGDSLERRYRERPFAYFARLVRRARVVLGDELIALLEGAVARGQLSEGEAEEIAHADVVIRGRRREDDVEVYLRVYFVACWGQVLSALTGNVMITLSWRFLLTLMAYSC